MLHGWSVSWSISCVLGGGAFVIYLIKVVEKAGKEPFFKEPPICSVGGCAGPISANKGKS